MGIRFVRTIDPNWQPVPSAYRTIDGATAHMRDIPVQARAYLDAIRRPLPGAGPPPIGHNGGPPMDLRLPPSHPLAVLAPNGTIVGFCTKGAGDDILTLTRREFEWRLHELIRDLTPYTPTTSFQGVYYDLADRCVIGVQISEKSG